MGGPGKTLIGRTDRPARVRWFVLAWLALACHIALRSLAAIGSNDAETSSPNALGIAARLAARIEWPLPVVILAAAAWAFRRYYQPGQSVPGGAFSVSPDRRVSEVPSAGCPSAVLPVLTTDASGPGGAQGRALAAVRDFEPRQAGTVAIERQAPGGPVG